MGLLPWLEAVEDQKRVISTGWMWDFFQRRQESFFGVSAVVELLGKPSEIFNLWVVGVRGASLALERNDGAFWPCGVDPSGLGLRQEVVGGVVGESGGGQRLELVG